MVATDVASVRHGMRMRPFSRALWKCKGIFNNYRKGFVKTGCYYSLAPISVHAVDQSGDVELGPGLGVGLFFT